MASAFFHLPDSSFLFFLSDCTTEQRPVVLCVWMEATKEAGSGAQVPPVSPSGRGSVSALPTGDWSGGLSVN